MDCKSCWKISLFENEPLNPFVYGLSDVSIPAAQLKTSLEVGLMK